MTKKEKKKKQKNLKKKERNKIEISNGFYLV